MQGRRPQIGINNTGRTRDLKRKGFSRSGTHLAAPIAVFNAGEDNDPRAIKAGHTEDALNELDFFLDEHVRIVA